MRVYLWDIDNDVEITHVDIASASPTLVTSADIKSSLTLPKNLGIKYSMPDGFDDDFQRVQGGGLIVCQNDYSTGRSSAFFHSLYGYLGYTGFVTWSTPTINTFKPRLNDLDGNVDIKFQVYLKTTARGIAQARLFDVTTNKAVPYSTVTTTQTVYTLCQSGNLNLDPDHEYYLQVRNTVVGSTMYLENALVRVHFSEFTRCVSYHASFETVYYEENTTWALINLAFKTRQSLVDGANGLDWYIDWNITVQANGYNPHNAELYDITASALVDSIEHNDAYSGVLNYHHIDALVLPTEGHLLGFRTENQDIGLIGQGAIIACQYEEFVANQGRFADPTQPSGFHAFMRQFLKNSKDGYVPFLTPDGINKCW